jgi:hypothetical protein
MTDGGVSPAVSVVECPSTVNVSLFAMVAVISSALVDAVKDVAAVTAGGDVDLSLTMA